MGNKSEKEVRTMISNEINVQVRNYTENISNVFNQTTTKISTEMVNEAAAKIDIKTITSNLLRAKDITAVGSSISIEQQAQVQATNQAIISIVADQSKMNELANKIATDVANKSQNDQQLKASLDAVNKIGENTKNAGGPEQMIDKVMSTLGDAIKNLTGIGGSDSTKAITDIKNKINTVITNETINRQDVKNIVENVVSSNFKQAAEAKCDLNTDTNQTIDVGNLTALALQGKSADINIRQLVSATAFNTCLIKMEMGQKVTDKLMNGYEFKSANDTTNTTKVDSGLKAQTELTKKTEQESAIMNSVDNLVDKATGLLGSWVYVLGGVVLIAILGVVFLVGSGAVSPSDFTPMGAATRAFRGGFTEELADTLTQEGGNFLPAFNEGNIYLYVAILAIFLFVYSKSIPACGVLLAVLVGYIIYQNKKKITV
jgi:hypothetical protein